MKATRQMIALRNNAGFLFVRLLHAPASLAEIDSTAMTFLCRLLEGINSPKISEVFRD
jgi:hypothetical protein